MTRVLWIPAGDFLVLGAVSLAMLRQGEAPGTIWIAMGLGALAAGAGDASAPPWRGSGGACARHALGCLLPPLVMAPLIALAGADAAAGVGADRCSCSALIAPMGFAAYRLAFRPLADRSVLVLLFMAVAVHFCADGLRRRSRSGPRASAPPPFLPGRLDAGMSPGCRTSSC